MSNSLVAGRAADQLGGWRLPAEPVEAAARMTLAQLLESHETLDVLVAPDCSADGRQRLQTQLAALAERVASAPAVDARDLLLALDAHIEISDDRLTASVAAAALARHLGLHHCQATRQRVHHERPLAIRKRGVETRLVLGEVARHEPDSSLVELLVEAHRLRQQVLGNHARSLRQLARKLGREHRSVARTLPLAFLAPDITEAILDGRQPIELTASRLKQLDPGLLDWGAQRRALGFAPTA